MTFIIGTLVIIPIRIFIIIIIVSMRRYVWWPTVIANNRESWTDDILDTLLTKDDDDDDFDFDFDEFMMNLKKLLQQQLRNLVKLMSVK